MMKVILRCGSLLKKMLKDITHLVERLDNKGKRLVNCAGCIHKIGKVCSHHKAILQSNPHRPTDCENWEGINGNNV